MSDKAPCLLMQDFEIGTYTNDVDWEDALEISNELLGFCHSHGKTICWLTAGGIDWLGNSGYKVGKIEAKRIGGTDYMEFSFEGNRDVFSWISGINGDWSFRLLKDAFPLEKDCKTPKNRAKFGFTMFARVFHHDCPTGGERVATFLSGMDLYKRLTEKGKYTKNELVDELKENGYLDYDKPLKDIKVADIAECFEDMSGSDLQDYVQCL